MIVHPGQQQAVLETVAGRLLTETFGLVGKKIRDLDEPKRFWRIDSFFSPVEGLTISGIRARVVDDKGFISFCNQRDLEVLLDMAQPGEYCQWLGSDYVSPFDQRAWFGFCLDMNDLMDDLFIREVELRGAQHEMVGHTLLPTGLEMTRRIHTDDKGDKEELLYLRGDFNAETGVFPDLELLTINERWVSIERRLTPWRHC